MTDGSAIIDRQTLEKHSSRSNCMAKISYEAHPPLSISIHDPEFANKVARHVASVFSSLDARAARPQPRQWTVLAAFLLYNEPKDTLTDSSLSILSLSTGLKCVAQPMFRDEQVIDMHAEVLARRELELLLVQGLSTRKKKSMEVRSDELSKAEIFALHALEDLVSDRGQLLLYSSHVPCGSASNAAHLARMDQEDHLIRQVLGSGSMETSSNAQIISTFRQDRMGEEPPLTKKPSRADAPPSKSYSCSDKLSRYQVLGFQGGRLSHDFERLGWPPLRLSGFIVGEDCQDGHNLQVLFGGTVADHCASNVARQPSYSRVTLGLQDITKGETDVDGLRYITTLNAKTLDFVIYPTTYAFPHSRRAVMEKLGATNLLAIDSLTEETRDKLRTLPPALAREQLIAQPKIVPFPISCSWRPGQPVNILDPAGRPNGVARNKRCDNEAKCRSRVCRKNMREAYLKYSDLNPSSQELATNEEIVSSGKGGPGWRIVSEWMEQRGPWKGWHRVTEDNAED